MKVGTIKYLLGLNPRNFLVNMGKARAEEEKTRKKAEKPMRLKADVRGLINGFATAGLAIDGVQRTMALIRGPLQDVINLANQQEKAEQAVASALRSSNQLTEENLALLKQQASAIQAVTTSGDESNLMLQAQALEMEIAFDQIDEVTRGAIGLATSFATAGLNQETALKGIALAYQGNFTQLQRYIPALRTAKDEAEKMEILQKTMADGFRRATEEAQTGAGQMKQLSNTWGDIKEIGGELVKEVLVPIVQIAKPTLEFFANLSPAARNTGLAMTVLIAGTAKATTAIAGLRAALTTLKISMGPTGWLLLVLSGAATALGIYAASADDAEEANRGLEESNLDLADSFDEVTRAAIKEFQNLTYDELIKERERLNGAIGEGYEQLQQITDQVEKGTDEELHLYRLLNEEKRSQERETTERSIQENQARLRAIEKTLQDRRDVERRVRGEMTEDELRELDKLNAYRFETNRLALTDYIRYLQSRLAAIRDSFGQESIEYLKLKDRIAELQAQQGNVGDLGDAGQLQIRPDTSGLEAAAEPLRALFDFQTDFTEQTYADLEATYNARVYYANLNVQTAAEAYGRDTDAYRQAVTDRWTLEQNFQNRKRDLAIEGAQATLNLSSQLMGAFAGESETLFAIGQAASIAQAIVNAHEAASKALAAYPPPFNIGAAALSYGLAIAEAKKIAAVKFNAPGYAQGTDRPLSQGDILQSVITPPGEDGVVGVRFKEMIMNERAVDRWGPLLVAMNRDRFQLPPGRAAGGPVGDVSGSSSPTLPFATSNDIDRLIKAIEKNRPVIRSELDYIRFYRETFRKWERLEEDRRVD